MVQERWGRGMKKVILVFVAALLLAPLLVRSQESAETTPVDLIQVIRILPKEEKALIKTPDGKLQIIKNGDLIGGNKRISEIAEGRVVIEERTATGIETVIIRVEDKNQRVERIRKIEEKQPVLLRAQ
jgi:hypothetical protein